MAPEKSHIRHAVDRLRREFRAVWAALFASRAVLFALLIIFYLLHSGQGEELTSSLVSTTSYSNWLLFVAIFAWAAQSWLWSSIAIALSNSENDDPAKAMHTEWVREIAPLLFAIAVFGVALEPLIQTENSGVVSLIGVSILSLFAGTVAWLYSSKEFGRSFLLKETSRPQIWRDRAISTIAFSLDVRDAEKPQISTWWRWVMASFFWSIAGLSIGIAFTLVVGHALGTLGTVFFAMSILLPFAAAASIATRLTRIPTLSFLILAPFVLPAIYSKLLYTKGAAGIAALLLAIYAASKVWRRSFLAAAAAFSVGLSLGYLAYYGTSLPLGVPHEVRTINSQANSAVWCSDAKQIMCPHSISAELGHWVDKVGEPRSKNNFVVFVSAAGGGLRAGYWTASILARLYDCVPGFNERLFAISGVSGGSLGAGLYAALARDAQSNHETSSWSLNCVDYPLNVSDAPLPKRAMQSKIKGFLDNDFLAPVIASLLFRDLPQSVIPIQFIPDRAAILEKAFEQAWRAACSSRIYGPDCLEPNQFEQSFFQVRDSAGWIPVLFLNGTHEESGKRLITSQIRIDQESFFDALDFFDLVGRDVSLSTAVLNSARFPFVSPSGSLGRPRSAKDIELTGSIIDGGFFENYGATTLQEVVEATMKYLKTTKPLTNWRPLVIEITNDVDIEEADLSRRRNEMFKQALDAPLSVKPRQDTEIANQLLGAAMGLYATRTARGILASKMLSDFVVDKSGGEFVQFRLCPHMRPSPPLGWLLTSQSQNSMDQLILGHGRQEYQHRYADYLSGADLIEYKSCFDDVQQGLSVVRQLLN